ncbi:MAG: sel1 repeat family protein [Acetatifactor sp.]|nr:sel1 repeat family protein [Acetatifactor sp.]
MESYFNPIVDKAIEDIYYCYDNQRAAQAAKSLSEAVDAGDGDAAYLLSRCYSGPEYSWKYHCFEFGEDDAKVEQLIRQSVMQGSAMGVLGSMRVGMLTPELEAAMPFPSLKAAWDIVYEKAQAGCAFAQNMIGNTYFWGDIFRIEKQDLDSLSREELIVRLRESMLACVPWFERAIKGGMGFSARNLFNLYLEGEKNLIDPEPSKAWILAKQCAELGHPDWQLKWGRHLQESDQEKEGLDWCLRAANQGQLDAWFYVGRPYQDGKVVPKDAPYALSCYEKGMEDPNQIGCLNRAAQLLFLGQDGVTQDYARAVRLLEEAHALHNDWGNDMLGICYLFGYGCQKDPVRARSLFEEVKWSTDLLNYGLGLIYADGLGVPEDIKKGVAYLQKAQNYRPAQEALSRFKKTLFGKWVRR